MKKILSLIITLSIFLSLTSVALASDVTGASYLTRMVVSNNGSGTVTNEVVTVELSTADMINAGLLNATATDAAMRESGGTDESFQMSANSTYPLCTWVDTLGGYGSKDLYLYSEGASGGKYRYFPDAAGMATPDSASTEFGENFTSKVSGFLITDNGTDKNVINKPDAVSLYIEPTASGNFTAEIEPHFEDIFDADDWTDTGIKILVDTTDSRLEYEAERSVNDDRSSIAITAVPDTGWKMPFIWNPTSKGGADGIVAIGIFDAPGNINGFATDAVFIRLIEDAVEIRYHDDGAGTSSSSITIVHNTTYYATLSRTMLTNVRLSIYSDTTRLTHIAGSPVNLAMPAGVTGLDTVQVSNNDDNIGAANEQIGWFDNVVIGGAKVTVTGVTGDEYDIEVIKSADSELWGTGSVLLNTAAVGGVTNFGDIYPDDDKFAISLWFKLDDAWAVGGSGGYPILWANSDLGNSYILLRFRQDDGSLEFIANKVGVSQYFLRSGQRSWDAGVWYHVICSANQSTGGGAPWSGARQVVNYTGIVNQAGTFATPDVANTGFRIGANGPGAAGGSFPGQIMNVAVFTDDITRAEELGLYNKVIPADATDIWYLDEGTGTRINSYGSSSNNGTMGGAASWVTSTHTGADDTGRLNNFTLSLDGVRTGINTHTPVSVNDNSENWTFFENNVMPYMEDLEIKVGGVQKQYIEWEYATTFTDSSGYGNDAVPTFRTTGSNSDVTAVIASQVTTMTEATPTIPSTTGFVMIDAAPTEPSELFTEGGTGYPGGPEVEELATTTNVPYMVWAVFLAYGLSIGLGAAAYGMTHNSRLGRNGSLFVFWIVSTIVMVVFVIGGGGVVPGWGLIPYGFACFALMLWFNPFKTAAG